MIFLSRQDESIFVRRAQGVWGVLGDFVLFGNMPCS